MIEFSSAETAMAALSALRSDIVELRQQIDPEPGDCLKDVSDDAVLLLDDVLCTLRRKAHEGQTLRMAAREMRAIATSIQVANALAYFSRSNRDDVLQMIH